MNTQAVHPHIGALLVQDAMHVGVLTCDRDTPLADVAATMSRERVHCVVVDGGSGERAEPWGVVSDLDLIAAATVRELDDQTAEGSAATPLVMVAPAEPLDRAAQLMTEHGISHLLVVEPAGGAPVGVLSTIDIAAALTEAGR